MFENTITCLCYFKDGSLDKSMPCFGQFEHDYRSKTQEREAKKRYIGKIRSFLGLSWRAIRASSSSASQLTKVLSKSTMKYVFMSCIEIISCYHHSSSGSSPVRINLDFRAAFRRPKINRCLA